MKGLPNQNDVETFWHKIWGESKEFNYNALWISKIEKSYCTNVKKLITELKNLKNLKLLFILSVSPLSFLLTKLKGYSLDTGNNRVNVTVNFFVDDLKLYVSTLNIIKKQ